MMVKKKVDVSPGVVIAFIVIVALVIMYDKIFGKGSRANKNAGVNINSTSGKKYMYPSKKCSRAKAAALPTTEQARAAAAALGNGCKFLLSAKQQLQRDYVLIIDRSGSMSGALWTEATESVKVLAPHICKFDPDGVTLILFDHEVIKFDNVTSAGQVAELMSQNPPRGSTDLAAALDTAFSEYFIANSQKDDPCSILVITDGAPNDREAVARCITAAANAMELDAELSVSFVQIGEDRSAMRFLAELDDDLQEKYRAKFDIVDTVSAKDQQKMSFNEFIANSLYD